MVLIPPQLNDTGGQSVTVDQGESLDLQVTIKDADGNTIDAASTAVTAITFTLYDYATNAVINSRNSTDVKDNGIGAIASSLLTVRLTTVDNTIVSTATVPVGQSEKHVGRVNVTYNDGTASRVEIQETQWGVIHLATPTT